MIVSIMEGRSPPGYWFELFNQLKTFVVVISEDVHLLKFTLRQLFHLVPVILNLYPSELVS